MSYNELKRNKKRVAFVSNTSSFTGWSDNFGAKWQLWCRSDDFNQKVWVAMHGAGWRVKKWWHQCVDTTMLKMYERTDVDQWDDTGFWCLTHIYLSATYESIHTGAIFLVVQMFLLCGRPLYNIVVPQPLRLVQIRPYFLLCSLHNHHQFCALWIATDLHLQRLNITEASLSARKLHQRHLNT
jgi:hypothetical protein